MIWSAATSFGAKALNALPASHSIQLWLCLHWYEICGIIELGGTESDSIPEALGGQMNDIERVHLLDLSIATHGESTRTACEELTVGLLVQSSILISRHASGDDWNVVRFTGPRSQLEELRNRYNGVAGAFRPSDVNPDGLTEDEANDALNEQDPVARAFVEDMSANPGKYPSLTREEWNQANPDKAISLEDWNRNMK